MDKYAAEKIASEYYNLGTQLALDSLIKTANPLVADALRGVSKAMGRGSREAVKRVGPVHGPAQFASMHGRGGPMNAAALQKLQNAPIPKAGYGSTSRPLSRIPQDQYNEVIRNLKGPDALKYLEGNPTVQGYIQKGLNRTGLTNMTPREMLAELPGRGRR